MKKISLILLLIGPLVYANIGTVIKLKGEASLKTSSNEAPWSFIELNHKLNSGDKIKTAKSSFVKAEMIDQTVISIGPNSEFHFSKFKVKEGKRFNIYGVLTGKMRAIIKKRATKGEKIQFTTGVVAMGVRGTEFLVNSYQAGGKKVSDVFLLKGKLRVNPSKLNISLKNFTLKAGESFNSTDLMKNGIKAIKKIDPSLLEKLIKNKNEFGANLQLSNGSFLNPLSTIGKGLATAGLAAGTMAAGGTALALSSSPISNQKSDLTASDQLMKKKLKSPVKENSKFVYNLKKEPRDIREALINKKKDRKANKCYYWFYKKLPGASDLERFKRERDCDEFDYEL